jgi:hypothetical protein
MTTEMRATATSSSLFRPVRVVLTLAAAAVVAVAANTVVSITAIAAGAKPSFLPLSLALYGTFTVLGLVAGYVGWRIIRSRARRPLAVLRVAVPVLAVLSLVPDTVNALVHFIPDTTVTGVVGLMIMHLVVVGVGVPVYQRLAPVR